MLDGVEAGHDQAWGSVHGWRRVQVKETNRRIHAHTQGCDDYV